MKPTIFDRVRPFVSKVLAAPIAIALIWAANKTGLVGLTDPEVQIAIVSGITWLISTVIHTFISKWSNPANTATTELAAEGKRASVEMKAIQE